MIVVTACLIKSPQQYGSSCFRGHSTADQLPYSTDLTKSNKLVPHPYRTITPTPSPVRMSPGTPAKATAIKAVEAWASLEKQDDDVADAPVQDHKVISMDKKNDTQEEKPDRSDDEETDDGDDTERP